LEKQISSPAIQFKGNGWYITDYARKNSQPGNGKEAPCRPKKETAPKEKPEKKAPAQTAPKSG